MDDGSTPAAHRRQSNATEESGFSLVELVMASAVLLVVSLAGYSAQVRSGSLIDTSQGRASAMADLETCMEDLLAESTVLIPDSFPVGASIPEYEGLHLRDERITPAYPGYTGGGSIPDPLQVVLTATWTSGTGHMQSLRLATAKAR